MSRLLNLVKMALYYVLLFGTSLGGAYVGAKFHPIAAVVGFIAGALLALNVWALLGMVWLGLTKKTATSIEDLANLIYEHLQKNPRREFTTALRMDDRLDLLQVALDNKFGQEGVAKVRYPFVIYSILVRLILRRKVVAAKFVNTDGNPPPIGDIQIRTDPSSDRYN